MENSHQSIVIDSNTITIYQMKHPAAVSDFIRCIRFGLNKGYSEFKIEWKGETVFPNACVPICGIIQYYKRNYNILFHFNISENDYLYKCSFENPFCKNAEEIKKENSPFDKIFEYNDSKQVAELTQAYIDTISRTSVCATGVIEGLIWCINEVMDNVLVHSREKSGYVMAQYHPTTKHIAICVYDYGIGIYTTLKDTNHKPRTQLDALSLSVQEGVGDGKGQGNGLFGLFGIVANNDGRLTITSGSASIMYSSGNDLKKFEHLPFLSYKNYGTIVDFQLDLNKAIDIKSVFKNIGGFDGFDIRLDDMRQDDDRLLYNVYDNCSGTATRLAGLELRNDVLNSIRRVDNGIILDFSNVKTVSSSFIDEFIAKMVLDLGFSKFNNIVKIIGMNETIEYLCDRAVFMRIHSEWSKIDDPNVQ